jgi:hypothetical protein
MIKNKKNNFQIFINNLFERANSDIFINILSFLFPVCETSDVKDPEDGLKKLIKKNFIMISNELSKLRQKNFKFYYSLSSNINYNVYSSPQIIKFKKISKIQRNIYFVKASFLENAFTFGFGKNKDQNDFFGKFLLYYNQKYQKKNDYISTVIFCIADKKKNNYGFQKIQPLNNFNICFNGKEKQINHEITSILFPGYDEFLIDSNGFDIFGYNVDGYDINGYDQSNNKIQL